MRGLDVTVGLLSALLLLGEPGPMLTPTPAAAQPAPVLERILMDPKLWGDDAFALFGSLDRWQAAGETVIVIHPDRVVSAWRFVVDTDDLDQALTALAPGQSEHTAHPNATDGIERWMDDRLALLSTSDPVIQDGGVHRLVLVPHD